MADKRNFGRLRKRFLVTFEVEGRTVAGFTIDLSHTGLLISSLHLPRIGDSVRLVLNLQNGKEVEWRSAPRAFRSRRPGGRREWRSISLPPG